MTLGDVIAEYRNSHDISMDRFAELSSISKGYISMLERNQTQRGEEPSPSIEMYKNVAKVIGVDVDELIRMVAGQISLGTRTTPSTDVLRIPVYGTIPAGVPMEAIENILGMEEAPAKWSRGGKEYFALKIKGDSMSPMYLDGDVIIFQKTPTCDSGKDCCVVVNGDDSTFKRVFISERGITLQPLNPAHEPRFYTNEEVENLPVEILGTVKELRRTIH
jgi:SOS-response transcriptional repressors (RecA-mediated autopeptidases)